MSELFPTSFMQAVTQLRLRTGRAPHARDAGEHSSRAAGAGLDFRDFRPYTPGDDLRRVDWNAYRRSRRLITRLFEEQRRVDVHVLLDVSDSMFFETPPRANAARQVAVAIAAAACEQHDAVSVYPFGEKLGESVRLAGPRSLPMLLERLRSMSGAGPTRTANVVGQLAAMRRRAGMLVLISDFFDPAGLDGIFDALSRLRDRLLLIRVQRVADAAPLVSGDVELMDCESGQVVRVGITDATRQAYTEAFRTFEDKLRSHANRRRATLVSIDADAPVVPQLERLRTAGVLGV